MINVLGKKCNQNTDYQKKEAAHSFETASF
jgi:hypothetical protein